MSRHTYEGIPLDNTELQSIRPESSPSIRYSDTQGLLAAPGPGGNRASSTPSISESISGDFAETFRNRHGPNVQWDVDLHESGAKAATKNLQAEYNAMGQKAQAHLARQHSDKKQFFHLLTKILLRWFASFLLSVAMMVVFYRYEGIKVLDDTQKSWFNALSTGLYLTLGLNLAGSFKGMATIFRWKLLARKKHNLEEIDLILGINSLIKVFRYSIHCLLHRPFTSFVCFSWIMLNCIGRLSVALTGLTYSYDSADAISTRPGIVQITNFEHFWLGLNASVKPELSAEHHTAHSWGLFSSILGIAESPEQIDDQHVLEFDGIRNEWKYHFREFSPDTTDPLSHRLSHRSGRYVTIKSKCEHFPLIKGQDGNSSSVTYRNGTSEITLTGISDYAPGATTWINPRGDLPENPEWNCGPRCSAVAALQFIEKKEGDKDDSREGSFFTCKTTVSKVHGAVLSSHEISDRMAFIAAGAIGLEGYAEGPTGWEYVRYFPGTPWGGNVGDDEDLMAMMVGKFACGVLAANDLNGRVMNKAVGDLPWQGVLFKVLWPQLFAILGGILLFQMMLGISCVIYSNTVFCKDDSYLSTARLLRPIVDRLGHSGCALTGREISHALHSEMIYGVTVDETGTRHHLDIGEGIGIVGEFPEGWYDGEVTGIQNTAERRAIKRVRKEIGRTPRTRKRGGVRGKGGLRTSRDGARVVGKFKWL